MNSPFYSISEEEKKKLFTLLEAHIYSFNRGQNILGIIKNDNVIGIVDEGSAEIIRTNYDGGRSIIDKLYKDSIFGTTISSIDSSEFKIIAKEDTTVIIIDYNRLLDVKNIDHKYYNVFIQNLFSIVNISVKAKNERIKILTRRSIRNKLLEFLRVEQNKNHSRNIYLPFNFTELADYLSIDRCAMTRELKYLKEEGFIEIKGKRITMLY